MIGKSAAAAAALLALLALTACGPGSPTPTPATTSGSTATADPDDEATPGPTEVAADRPTPRFDASCDTLVPTSLLTPILPFAYEVNDVLRTQYFATPSIPRHGAVAQVGGLLCEWSNGEHYSSETGSSAFRGIQLSVLPEARSGWELFADYYGFAPTADSVSCFAASGVCSLDVHADGYWFSAEIATTVGAGTEAAVRALGDHLQAATSGFGTLREPWYPTGLQVIPSDCDVTLPGLSSAPCSALATSSMRARAAGAGASGPRRCRATAASAAAGSAASRRSASRGSPAARGSPGSSA